MILNPTLQVQYHINYVLLSPLPLKVWASTLTPFNCALNFPLPCTFQLTPEGLQAPRSLDCRTVSL